jgi:hypothetical protein
METWTWIVLVLVAVIKLPIAALMLWLPFRYDEAAYQPSETTDSSEEDGGSKALPGGPLDRHPRGPLPRNPRRGPHGSPSPGSPKRVRSPLRATRRARRPLRIASR